MLYVELLSFHLILEVLNIMVAAQLYTLLPIEHLELAVHFWEQIPIYSDR